MSERGEVEVLLPLDRVPTKKEQKDLLRIAFAEARKIVKPTGGRVLGLSAIIRAENPITSQLALKVRFAVEAPEDNFKQAANA